MAVPLPRELSGLLGATDPATREAAWAAFLKAHSRLLLHTARSLGRDYDAAMDGYAYVLGQLRHDDYRRLRAYVANGRSKFTTWLVVVARRLCLDSHRQRYGRVRDPDAERAEQQATRRRLSDLVAEQVDPATLSDPAAQNPEADLLARERRQALAVALEKLEARDLLLVRLRFEDELSAREIADVMGFPTPFHVYRRLNALTESLRRALRGSAAEEAAP